MVYFVVKILIAIGLIGLAGLVFAILKSKGEQNENTDRSEDDWFQF